MVKVIAAIGWVAVMALGALCYRQYMKVEALEARLAASRAAQDATTARVAALEEEARARASVDEATTTADPGSVTPPKNFDPSALIKGMFGAATSGESKPQDAGSNSDNPFESLFRGENGERMMETSADMSVNMQYAALFGELNLAPEKEEALRAALSTHMRARMKAGVDMMRNKGKPEDIDMPTDADLLAAAAEILDKGELEQFENYQAELPERMMRQSMEMQLNMFAGGLTEEARAITVDVLVENLMPADGEHADPLTQPDFSHMQEGYENALVQLESELSEEDLSRVRRFIEQQQTQFEAFSNMMERRNGNNGEENQAQ